MSFFDDYGKLKDLYLYLLCFIVGLITLMFLGIPLHEVYDIIMNDIENMLGVFYFLLTIMVIGSMSIFILIKVKDIVLKLINLILQKK